MSQSLHGLLIRLRFAGSLTRTEAAVQYEYDGAGNRTAAIDELGRRTEFSYDPYGRLTSVTLPDPDGPGPLATPIYTYVYNALGRL